MADKAAAPTGAPPSKRRRLSQTPSSVGGKDDVTLEKDKSSIVAATVPSGAEELARRDESSDSLALILMTDQLGAVAEYAGIKSTLLGLAPTCRSAAEAVEELMGKVKTCTSNDGPAFSLALSWWHSLAAGRFPIPHYCESVRGVFKRVKRVVKRRKKGLRRLYEKKIPSPESENPFPSPEALPWYIDGSPMSREAITMDLERELKSIKHNPCLSYREKVLQLQQDGRIELMVPPDTMDFLLSFGGGFYACETEHAESYGCKGMYPVNSLDKFSLEGEFIPDGKDCSRLWELGHSNEESEQALLILTFAEVDDTEHVKGGRLGVAVHPPQLRGEIWYYTGAKAGPWRYLAPNACSWMLEVREENQIEW